MASGNRSEFGNWGLDKSELNLDYCDVGLGLKIPWQHQQQQQQQEAPQGSSLQQQRQQHCNITGAVPWLHNRQILADNNRVTFTAGQRQELERQTIIYKYMMSSLPVPPELLIPFSKYPSSNSPITTTSSPSEVGRKTGVEMRYTMSRGGDPEPWRCRRTDGKKWRCSRDVAPDQKYCERHSHKGRPSRSRKPVEPPSSLLTSNSHNNNNNNNNNNNVNVTLPSITSNPTTFFSPYTISKPSSSPSSFELPCIPQLTSLPRYPDWFMKKDIAPTPTIMYSPQHQLVTGETTSSHQLNDEHHQNCLLSRPFIDAWSLADPKNVIDNENNDNNTLATNKCPPPASSLNSILPLTLSMSAGVDLENHDTGDNIKDHLEIRSSSPSNNQPLYWMNSWVSSPPGGPLAEALCLGMSGTGNGLMMSHSEDHLVSPHGCSTSSTTTTLG